MTDGLELLFDAAVVRLDFAWLPERDFARLPELDLRRAVGFERAADFVEPPDFVAPDFVEPLDLVEPLAFVEPLFFAAPLLAFVERLAELFARGEEPLDDPLLDRLRGLLEVDLPFAILILLVRGTASLTVGLPALAAANPRPDGRSRRKR